LVYHINFTKNQAGHGKNAKSTLACRGELVQRAQAALQQPVVLQEQVLSKPLQP